ncbi:Dipeptidyl aminopeptidase/acylaminoacyl peptidase [Opitutus sp. GAS368]|jgi:dipeptidyl aminopeptidase/acylaminoacyl peptidase|nr:Dipeptidyl aminopeptidase/acylaminoacyl peptidase [Opitutus sp. GAS368]
MRPVKFHRRWVLLGGLAWLVAAAAWAATNGQAPPVISIEDFARSPDLSAAQLAPDGKFMGYLFTHEGRTEMGFLDLATGKARYFNPGRSFVGSNLQMAGFRWVSNERVVVQTTVWGHFIAGLAAVNRTTAGWLGLTGAPRLDSMRTASGMLQAYEILYASGHDPTRVLLLERTANGGGKSLYPDVLMMDATTGGYQHILANPGEVTHWLADWDGVVRFGLKWNGKLSQLIYRELPTAPWQFVPDLGNSAGARSFVGLDKTGRIIHVAQTSQKGRWAIYPLDLQKQQLGEALFADDEYDVLPPDFRPGYADEPLAEAIYSAKTRELLGVRYMTEGPRQKWFNPAIADLQRQIDALHPGLINLIVSMDQAEGRLLVLSFSDREPGFYSLVDLAAHKVSPLGQRMPWINPEQLAVMYPVKCTARDGLPLHGYLTLPAGGGRKNLPLVMLVHGGPWVRDVWGFDPLVQFLANRGYAVLQINYRGSTGYGLEFAAKGKAEVGGAIQDDITDAVRWTIEQGVADPKRIAIMGASYGGYSALFALAKTPELYRCGIDIAGVTDWPDLLETHNKDDDYKIAYAYWEERLGEIKSEKVHRQLTEASPMNFAGQIKAPLLIVHGKEDQVVPLSQTTRLVALMKKQGLVPETMYLSDLGHSFPHDKQGVEFLRKLERFLAANLGP